MTQNLVSVIIPTYNCSETLGRCIESAINQTVNALEIIVINDGSTDNTREVIKHYRHQIHYVEQPNMGQGAARNAGLNVASGEYVAFLDSDDFWLSDFLKTCILFLESHSKAVAVSTGYILNKIGNKQMGPVLDKKDKGMYQDGAVIDNFFQFWAKYDHVRTGTVLIRKKTIDKAGFQREDLRISQDLEYWGYLATYGKWGFIPKHLWVGDSVSIAAGKGWTDKYLQRRQLCPDVESWERRIIQRLKKEHVNDFKKVRGRVSDSFAYNKLLGGDTVASKHIVTKYGHEMPDSWTAKLMIAGVHNHLIPWEIICRLLQFREKFKSMLLFYFPSLMYQAIKLLKVLLRAKKSNKNET